MFDELLEDSGSEGELDDSNTYTDYVPSDNAGKN